MSALDTSVECPSGQAQSGRSGVLDGIVFQRYEYKYAVPPGLMEPIRSFIRPYCEMDWFAAREQEKFYTITSLYLDTTGYKTYWEKEQEVLNRFKLRIRTYGNESQGPVKFEVKRRFNEVVRKTSVVVPLETWPALIAAPGNGASLRFSQYERPAFDDFIRLIRTFGVAPKMLVRYQRQAFRSRIDRYVRITFDRHLLYQPTSSYDLTGQSRNWQSNDDPASLDEFGPRVILELKFMTRAPVWLLDLVRTFGLMRRSFSKYCTAISRAIHARQTSRELLVAIPA
jgi:hypothetical protein